MKQKLHTLLFLTLLIFTTNSFTKEYDVTAKNTYSHNDVKAFVYQWFALFDHQVSIEKLQKHLPKKKLNMHFPNFPISTMKDFKRWYQDVENNIQFNSHEISNLKVTGDEKRGFNVSLQINWKANTYNNEHYDVDVFQRWIVTVDKNREFIITKHKAILLD